MSDETTPPPAPKEPDPKDPDPKDAVPKDPALKEPAPTDPVPADYDEILAAELALGLLEGEEAAAAVARLSADPAFAEDLRAWQERLAGTALGLTPVMAPARARQRIREKLGHAAAPLSVDPLEKPSRWPRLLVVLALLAVGAAIWWVLAQPG